MVDTLDISNIFAYDMFAGDTKVGTCNISIHPQYSGFQCPDTWKDKSVLEIDGFGTFQRNGYGRAGLQKCYELSQQMGCEGRIVVHATWGAGSFYEHCGFNSDNPGKPGIKYFEPTPENLEKLFKGRKKDNFLLKENIPDFSAFADFNLDDFERQKSTQRHINGDSPEISAMNNTGWGFSLSSLDNAENEFSNIKDNIKPELDFNPETGLIEYADKNLQKIAELRKRIKDSNIDLLEFKSKSLSSGLEEIGLSKDNLGKTGNSITGEITEKNREIAKSQTEDAKELMLHIKKLKEDYR